MYGVPVPEHRRQRLLNGHCNCGPRRSSIYRVGLPKVSHDEMVVLTKNEQWYSSGICKTAEMEKRKKWR